MTTPFQPESMNSWPYSTFRILWSALHLAFAGNVLYWTSAERHLPTPPYPGPLSILSLIPSDAILAGATLYVVLGILLFLGFRTRIVQALLAILVVPLFFHSVSLYHNHYAFYLLITLYCAIMPSERHYSLDARRKKKETPLQEFAHWQNEPVSGLTQRLIMLQAGFLYLFAALHKINPVWLMRWTTTREMLDLMEGSPLIPLWEWLLIHHLSWIPLLATAVLMFVLAGFLFFGRLPLPLFFAAIIMHLSFDLHFTIMQFTPMMIAVLLLAARSSCSTIPLNAPHPPHRPPPHHRRDHGDPRTSAGKSRSQA